MAAGNLWGPMMAVLEEWGLEREYRERIDGPEAAVEILATITVGKKRLDQKAVAAALGWPRFYIKKGHIHQASSGDGGRCPGMGKTFC